MNNQLFGLQGIQAPSYDSFLCGKRCRRRRQAKRALRHEKRSLKNDQRRAQTERLRAETGVLENTMDSPQQESPARAASLPAQDPTTERTTPNATNTQLKPVYVLGSMLVLGGLMYLLLKKKSPSITS
ncbi:MAG: hypothetical protein AAFN81_23580 [Bacteroidota bacterium]